MFDVDQSFDIDFPILLSGRNYVIKESIPGRKSAMIFFESFFAGCNSPTDNNLGY